MMSVDGTVSHRAGEKPRAVRGDYLVELRRLEPRCLLVTAPSARRSVPQQLNSETFVVPEGQRDAVAKGVEKVVLAVASWIADTKTFDLL